MAPNIPFHHQHHTSESSVSGSGSGSSDLQTALLIFGPVFTLLIFAIMGIATRSSGFKDFISKTLFRSRSGDDPEDQRVIKKPPSPASVPVFGHLHHLSKYSANPWDGFDSFRAAHGNIVSLQLGVWKSLLVSCPELIREVLLTKGEIFANRPNFERYRIIFGGDRENCKS